MLTMMSRDHKDTGTMTNVPENGLLGRQALSFAAHTQTTTPVETFLETTTTTMTSLKTAEPVLRGTDGRQMPTPTATRRSGLQTRGRNVISGSLNPTWIEWLQGFPRGWTDCERLVTPKSFNAWLRRSRSWLRELGF